MTSRAPASTPSPHTSQPPATTGPRPRSSPARARRGVAMTPSWQSTSVAIVLMAGVFASFLTLALRDGVEAGLMIWAALGPLVGIMTGAVTTYFFTGGQAAKEREERVEMGRMLAEATRARLTAEARMHLLLGMAGADGLAAARAMRPALFGEDATHEVTPAVPPA